MIDGPAPRVLELEGGFYTCYAEGYPGGGEAAIRTLFFETLNSGWEFMQWELENYLPE